MKDKEKGKGKQVKEKGTGKKTRERTCTNPSPVNNGRDCRGQNVTIGECYTEDRLGNYNTYLNIF